MSERTYTADELYSRLAWEDDCYELFRGRCHSLRILRMSFLRKAWYNLRRAYEEMQYFETEFMAELEEGPRSATEPR